jgi:hypothetical protein
MTVTAHVYGLALTSMLNAQINYPSATVRGMLVTSAYSPNQDTHRYKSERHRRGCRHRLHGAAARR